ncbi:MAG: glycosyltransferase, partial [Terriglobales bacterium]
VVHCGVETAARTPPPPRSQRGAGHPRGPVPDRPLRILSVGSLQAYKGHRHLLEACALLHGRGVELDCRIVGEGKLAPALRRQIADLGLGGTVAMSGAASECEVAQALAWAQVVAQPSVRARSGQMEGIPVALMEAMAAERAVVATRLSGVPELVRDGVEGLLVAPGDAAALAEALARLQDAGLRARLGRAGRMRVEQEFDLSKNVARLAQLWAEAGQPSEHGAAA